MTPASHGQEQAAATPAAAEEKSGTSPNHILAPNESIQIKVFNEPELDTSLRIAEDGKITFPLVGEVKLGGLTVQKASELMRERLTRFLVNPQVSISPRRDDRRLFTVLGQVQRPEHIGFPITARSVSCRSSASPAATRASRIPRASS